jgi:hypothetical protein
VSRDVYFCVDLYKSVIKRLRTDLCVPDTSIDIKWTIDKVRNCNNLYFILFVPYKLAVEQYVLLKVLKGKF